MADVNASVNSVARTSPESWGNLNLGGQANVPARSSGVGRGNLVLGGQANIPARSPGVGRAGLIITNAANIPARSTGNHGISLKIGGKANIPARSVHVGLLRFFLDAAYGPGFTVPVQPHIRGGCAVTFKGLPNRTVFWSLVGYDTATGFETDPAGRLRHGWAETNDLGYSINYYIASLDPADAGKIDRVRIYYADYD